MEVTFELKMLVGAMDAGEQVEALAEAYEAANDGARRAHRKEVLADYDDRDLLSELKLRGYNLRLQ